MLYTAEICNFILSAEYFQILGVVTSAVDEFTTTFFFFIFEKEFVSRNFSTFGYATFRHYVCDEFKRVPLHPIKILVLF